MTKVNRDEMQIREKFKLKRTPKKTLLKEKGKLPSNSESGIVVASIGKYLIVKDANGKLVQTIVSGTLITQYKNSNLVAVGDSVYFTREADTKSETGLEKGVINRIEPRISKISRVSPANHNKESVLASNIEQILIITAIDNPPYNRKLIDRYLIAAEIGEVKPFLCINKIDLGDSYLDDVMEDFEIYAEFGVETAFVSVENNIGLDRIKEILKDKKTLLSGPSGVGKSTLVNSLLDEKVQEVQIISERTNKGKHTTSATKMFELPFGGIIIDSPGIREYALWEIEPERLSIYYHDFDEYYDTCKYQPCSHTHEPGCGVRDAYQNGQIDPQRYESYLNLYDSIKKVL